MKDCEPRLSKWNRVRSGAFVGVISTSLVVSGCIDSKPPAYLSTPTTYSGYFDPPLTPSPLHISTATRLPETSTPPPRGVPLRPTVFLPGRVRKTATPRPTISSHETDIQHKIEQALRGEHLILTNVKIGYDAHIDRFDRTVIVTTIEANRSQVAGVISTDCIDDQAKKDNLLGNRVLSGLWKIEAQIDQLDADVVFPAAPPEFIPVLRATGIIYKGVPYDCHTTGITDEVAGTVRRIPWNSGIVSISQTLGRAAREIWDNVRGGWLTPTPRSK